MVETLARTDGQSELRGRGEGRKGYAYAGAGPARAKVHAVLSAESSPAGISPRCRPRTRAGPAVQPHQATTTLAPVAAWGTQVHGSIRSPVLIKHRLRFYLDAKYIGQTCSSTLLNYGLAHRILLMDTTYLYPS